MLTVTRDGTLCDCANVQVIKEILVDELDS